LTIVTNFGKIKSSEIRRQHMKKRLELSVIVEGDEDRLLVLWEAISALADHFSDGISEVAGGISSLEEKEDGKETS
jgi:hypothetical protein